MLKSISSVLNNLTGIFYTKEKNKALNEIIERLDEAENKINHYENLDLIYNRIISIVEQEKYKLTSTNVNIFDNLVKKRDKIKKKIISID